MEDGDGELEGLDPRLAVWSWNLAGWHWTLAGWNCNLAGLEPSWTGTWLAGTWLAGTVTWLEPVTGLEPDGRLCQGAVDKTRSSRSSGASWWSSGGGMDRSRGAGPKAGRTGSWLDWNLDPGNWNLEVAASDVYI